MGEKGCARAVHVSALARHSQPALAYGPRPLTRYLETGRIAVNTEPAALAANWAKKLGAQVLAILNRAGLPINV